MGFSTGWESGSISKLARYVTVSFAVLIMAISSLFPIGPAQNVGSADAADVVMNGDWIVTGIVIRAGDSITVEGNVSIRGTLILDDCNLTIDGTIAQRHWIGIEAGGRLVLRNGSFLKGPTGGRFIFFADARSIVDISNSTVFGCGYPSGRISESGIYSQTTNFTIRNSTIASGHNGLIAEGGSFDIASTTIIEVVNMGIVLMKGSTLNASLMTVRQAQGPGMRSEGSSFRIDQTLFENVEISIDAVNSSGTVSRTLLSSRTIDLFKLEGGSCVMVDVRPFLPGMDRGMLDSGYSGAELLMVNCTIQDVMVIGPNATARWAKMFDVIVTRNGGAPGAGAQLEFLDRFGSRTAVGLTGSSGSALDIVVPYYHKNSTISTYLTPHNLSVFLEGALRYVDVNVTLNYQVHVNVFFSTPVVTINQPAQGEWSKGSPVRLDADILDPRPITDLWMAIDGAAEVHIGGTTDLFMDLNLPDGWHTLMLRASNDDDRIGSASVEFGIDSEAPVLHLDPSSVKPYTNQSMIRLRGSCSEDATVWVGGQMYPVIGGRFDIARNLLEGPNRIEITAMDRAQNRDEEVVTITLDSIPPTIFISAPVDGTKIREVSVIVKGLCDPSTVKVSVNGIGSPLMEGHFETEVTGLKEGSNRIDVVAVDVTGSTTVKALTVIVDTVPPEITLSGFPSLTNQASIVVQGMTDSEDALVHVNGIPAEMDGLSFHLRTDLAPGNNYVEIRAQDPSGNIFILNKEVFMDNEAPSFESMDPASGGVLRDPVLDLHVRVFDESGVRAVKAMVQGKGSIQLREEEDWTAVLILSKGENSITLEAVDRAGNSALERATYIYRPIEVHDDVKPMVWFTTPTNGSVHNEGLIDIEGGSSDNVGVVSVELTVDSSIVHVNGTQVWHASVELQKGAHILIVSAIDAEGNFNTSIITVRVVLSAQGGAEKDDDQAIYIAAGLVLIIVLAIILAYLYSSNRRMRALVEEQAMEEEERVRRLPRSRGLSKRDDAKVRSPPRRMERPGPRAPPERPSQRVPRTK
jgi:hypothetical protein